MRPKICIIGYGPMAEMARDIKKAYAPTVDVIVYEALLNDDWVPPNWVQDVDVFLSGGYNAQKLRAKISVPVISMETRLSDLLMALEQTSSSNSELLYVPFQEKSMILEKVSPFLSVRISQKPFQTPQELYNILWDHKNTGGSSVITAGLGYVYGTELGLRPVFIRPENALLEYFQIALDMASSLRASSQRNSELMTILNYYDKGVLLANNGIITICNPLASNYFRHLNRPLVGMPIEELMKEIVMQAAVPEPSALLSPLLNQPCSIRDRFYQLDLIPIRAKSATNEIMLNIRAAAGDAGKKNISPGELSKGFVAKHSFQTLTYNSPSFSKAVHLARYYSQTDEAIVITGETGVGKEVMANAIHNNSRRAPYPFVAVNCSAMNSQLLESELFGYDEGAFTGARRGGKEGIFELANKGTIFLDEIGEINKEIQVKLLRAIQEKEIMRIGGTKIIRFDARIITATNQNLWKLVEEKQFREDLYYRINVLELQIPPLRERREDLFPLFSGFLRVSAPNLTNELQQHETEITALLNRYDWPGNIRELGNCSKMVTAMIGEDQSIQNLLSAMGEILAQWMHRRSTLSSVQQAGTVPVKATDSRRVLSMDEINTALAAEGGNRQRAAKRLGIDRTTLWRRLKNASS